MCFSCSDFPLPLMSKGEKSDQSDDIAINAKGGDCWNTDQKMVFREWCPVLSFIVGIDVNLFDAQN